MVECSECKSKDVLKVKEWDVKPKKKVGPKLHVTLYQCKSCGKKFRVVEKIQQ